MSCEWFEELASAHLDDRLSAAESQALELHVTLCRRCGEHAAELGELRDMLGELGPYEPRIEVAERVLAPLERSTPDDSGFSLGHLVRCLLPRFQLVPAAGILAFALLTLTGLGDPANLVVGTAAAPPGSASREASIMTVWDNNAEIIVTAVDPTGLTGCEDLGGYPDRCSSIRRRALKRRAPLTDRIDGSAPSVRIFLYERIVVKG